MVKYMVIESYHKGYMDKIYKRVYKEGRMLPVGLHFIESWLEKTRERCFQLMETDHPELFKSWIKNWQDLVDFEIVEIGEKPANKIIEEDSFHKINYKNKGE
jgi:hypothetical protein